MRAGMLMLVTALSLAACSADADESPTGPGDGNNLSFKLQGATVAVNAKWRALPNNRYRIEWQEQVGANYRNIEIDLYGNAPGTYSVKASPSTTGDAGFQYYVLNGGTATNFNGESGTVTLTSSAGDVLSGTFTVTTRAGTVSHAVTEGKFTSIPKQ